ncbi:MAG: response regulator [Calditrichaeota bacterium]|nr:MAG: response regulator [Calditrichota bacterium]
MSSPASDNEQHRRPASVLIVDDEEMVTQTLSTYLRLETDYEIFAFQSPAEALKLLRQRPVDLIISDFLMPDMDGLQFLSAAKKLYPDVLCILLTGYADKENAIKAINEVGLFQYIEKPWDNERLKLVIRNAIENKNLRQILREKIQELDTALLEKDKLLQDNVKLREELVLARNVQRSLLPHGLSINGVSIHAKYEPALEIGGDFYDIIPLAKGQIGVLIADVTGHGIQAALITVLLKSAFSNFKGSEASPGEILRFMNKLLYNVLPKSLYVAALIVTLDPKKSTVALANGGIPHPILLKPKSQDAERIPATGLLLGVADEELYNPGDELALKLDKGDRLILYTDGLSEASNEEERHFDEVIMQTLLEAQDKTGCQFLDYVTDAVRKFTKPNHNWDDVTILQIENLPVS